MLTLLSMQYMYNHVYSDYVILFWMYVHSTLYEYIVSMRHTIKQLRNDTKLVNDVITSAAHAHTLSN